MGKQAIRDCTFAPILPVLRTDWLRCLILGNREEFDPNSVTENHIGQGARNRCSPEAFGDNVGTGYYRIDLHPTVEGDHYLDVACYPFQIPLGALLAIRVENLLSVCKNIGTTHITNGCYRLHQSSGTSEKHPLCSPSSHSKGTRHLWQSGISQPYLESFKNHLSDQGVKLEWPNFAFDTWK